MNEFLNHLIAQNPVFIQVEKESGIYVFRFLPEQGIQNVMYKPGKKDFNLYWSKDCVIVTDIDIISPRTGKEINILLDVAFEDNPYRSVRSGRVHEFLFGNRRDPGAYIRDD